MIEITRGQHVPGEFTVRVNEEMLMFMERGTLFNIEELTNSLKAHAQCDLASDTGCRLSQERVAQMYGSLELAEAQHIYPVDCSEDLAYVHYALSQQMQLLFQSRYLRSVRDAPRALPSRPNDTAGTAKVDTGTLLALKEPTDDSRVVTGTIPKVVDDKWMETADVKEENGAVEEKTEGPQHRLKKPEKVK